jgi:hypothetical protein
VSEDIDMDTPTRRPVRSAVSLGLGVALLATAGVAAVTPVVSALASQGSAARPATVHPAVAARPASVHATVIKAAAPAGTAGQGLLTSPCTATAAAVGCDLYAREGAVVVHNGVNPTTLKVWTFASEGAATAATVGGASALLIGTVGVPMTITLHNQLPVDQALGLSIPQLDGVEFTKTVAQGAFDTFTFTPTRAGTYTYQAGLTADGSRQVAMGLVGALVVRPSSTQASAGVPGAYDTAESTFDDEAALVYTDVDTALAADPAHFNMRNYSADYHLINGVAYPDTTTLSTDHGRVLMLRVVNGRILESSPTLLGTRMHVFAKGSRPLPSALDVSGRTVNTGDTFDATIAPPALDPASTTPPVDTRYSIYDAPGLVRDGEALTSTSPNAPALGGAVTFIQVGGEVGITAAGPAVKGLAAAPTPGGAAGALTVSATLDTTGRGGLQVAGAEYYLDTLNLTAGGTALASAQFPIGSPASVSFPLDSLPLTTGLHTLWVRGQDAAGAWGPLSSIKIRVDHDGPAVDGVTLSDTSVNGKSDVIVSATVDERNTGGSLVQAARYWFDGNTASAVDLPTNGPRLVASADGIIPAASLPTTEGVHTLSIQGQDNVGAGQWGAVKDTTFTVDTTAPTTTKITLNPGATNGLVGSPNKPGYVTITTQLHDASPLTTVEGYLDKVGATDTPNALFFSPIGVDIATGDTKWITDMPLAWLAGKKTDQLVPLFVVGTDAAGNRSNGLAPSVSTTVNLDRTAPNAPAFSLAQGTTNYVTRGLVTVSFTATDPAGNATTTPSGINYAEWFVGTDPGQGRGTRFAFTPGASVAGSATFDLRAAGAFTGGRFTFGVRVRDAAGNWSTMTSHTINTASLAVFSNGFEPSGSGAAALWLPGKSPVGTGLVGLPDRIAGAQSLSVNAGTIGYYTENLVPLIAPAASMSYLHANFSMGPRGVVTGCVPGRNQNVTTCTPQGITVFSGQNAGGSDLVVVQYGRAGATSRVQFRIGERRGGGVVFGGWATVQTRTNYNVTVDWASAQRGTAALRVNGNNVVSQTTGNTTAFKVTQARIGVLAAPATAIGSILFDTVVLF